MSTVCSTARTVAVRGCWSISAISPNSSPLPMRERCVLLTLTSTHALFDQVGAVSGIAFLEDDLAGRISFTMQIL